jgi:hypothetical protein
MRLLSLLLLLLLLLLPLVELFCRNQQIGTWYTLSLCKLQEGTYEPASCDLLPAAGNADRSRWHVALAAATLDSREATWKIG